jgi:hypothetical protein
MKRSTFRSAHSLQSSVLTGFVEIPILLKRNDFAPDISSFTLHERGDDKGDGAAGIERTRHK